MRALAVTVLALVAACAHRPTCTEYRPAYSTVPGKMRLANSSGDPKLHVRVRTEGGNEIRGAVHVELTANGRTTRFDRDTVTVEPMRGPIRIQVRATGYRPADSTFATTLPLQGSLEVELPSLTIGTPPLEVCRP